MWPNQTYLYTFGSFFGLFVMYDIVILQACPLIAIVNKVHLIYYTVKIYQTTSMTIGLNNVI